MNDATATEVAPIIETTVHPTGAPMTDTDQPQFAKGESTDTPCAEHPLATRIEALLVSTDKPLTEARLAALLGIEKKGAASVVREAIDELNQQYEQTGRSFRVERLAGGYQMLTTPAFGPLLERLHTERQQSRLTPAALETLSVIAYRQPVMRAEIEAIRGVACGEVLRTLLERRLIKIVGRAEELGRPMLYGTTRQFLQVFGLSSLDDLPEVEGLQRRRSQRMPDAGGSGDTERADDADADTDADTDAAEQSPDAPRAEASATDGDNHETSASAQSAPPTDADADEQAKSD